jgi:hypothetical protein
MSGRVMYDLYFMGECRDVQTSVVPLSCIHEISEKRKEKEMYGMFRNAWD